MEPESAPPRLPPRIPPPLPAVPPVISQPPPLPPSAEQTPAIYEIKDLQNAGPNWWLAVMLFVASMFVFENRNQFRGTPSTLLMVVVILFAHELGHWIAMNIFQYRNPRMFFLPGFGRFCGGQRYGVAGWKQAVVALAGPLPGMIVGVCMAIAANGRDGPFPKVPVMLLLINGVNLLPVMPLDGGWILRATLFARHYWVETIVRLLAALGLILISGPSRSPIPAVIGIFLLVQLRGYHRLARITWQLRKSGGAPAAARGDTIPPESLREILARLTATPWRSRPPQTLARLALAVYERVNTRPTMIFFGIFFVAIQVTGLVVSTNVASQMRWKVLERNFQGRNFNPPGGQGRGVPVNSRRGGVQVRYQYQGGSLQTFGAKPADDPAPPVETLAGIFDSTTAAANAFQTARKDFGDRVSGVLFGQTVFLTGPARELSGGLKRSSSSLMENPTRGISVLLSCHASSSRVVEETQRELEAYLGAIGTFDLLPPWETSGVDKTGYLGARRALLRLREVEFKLASDANLNALYKAAAKLKKAVAAEAWAKHAAARKTKRAQLLAALQNESQEAFDHEMVKSFAAQELDLDGFFANASVKAKWAALLGEIPRATAAGRSAANEAAWAGDVTREGSMLIFHWVSFQRTAEGLPALAEWLSSRGFTGIQYNFQPGGSPQEHRPAPTLLEL